VSTTQKVIFAVLKGKVPDCRRETFPGENSWFPRA